MQAFVYRHGELVLNPLANWQPMKVAEHRSVQTSDPHWRRSALSELLILLLYCFSLKDISWRLDVFGKVIDFVMTFVW